MVTERRVFRYADVEFYADNGMVKLIDLRKAEKNEENAEIRLRPGEFLKRACAVRMFAKYAPPAEQRAASRLLEEATQVAKLAASQGDPCDPKVQEYHRKHTHRSALLIPEIPYKIKETDARTALLNGIELIPDLGI